MQIADDILANGRRMADIPGALGQSIFTEADSLSALRDQVRDAVKCHFEDGQAPKIIRLHFVREEVMAV